MQLRKAERKKAKIRLGLSAVSGGGKTYSGLLIAKGLCNGDLSKVAIIDTENGSADLYADLGNYNVISLESPFTPERYIEAIETCENGGMDVIIIDSITHEWDGAGGIMDISNSMTGNSYTNWAKITPRHKSFVDAILQSKCHVITTVRRKQDYEMVKNDKGKLAPQKVGLKEITREGFEYELTVNLELDTNHNATCSKDRTGLFSNGIEFKPSEETGLKLLEWCESGKAAEELEKEHQQRDLERIKAAEKAKAEVFKQRTIEVDAEFKACRDLKELAALFTSLTTDEKKQFLDLKDKLKLELTPKQ